MADDLMLADDEVVAAIETGKPDVVFAPHVETSAGVNNFRRS